MIKKFWLALTIVLLVSGCTPKANPPTPIPESAINNNVTAEPVFPMVREDVSYMASKQAVKGYMARPVGEGRYPTLILIHEWWGLNDQIRAMADEYAKLGYVALAVDLYEGEFGVDADKARDLSAKVRNNPDGAMSNLKSAVSFLKAQSYVDANKMASVGWCFGGGWSYQMAKNDLGVKATVMYYGQFNEADDLSQMKSHIIGHFGSEDQSIPVNDVKAFQAKLKTQSGDHEIYIYENAGHGFANKENPDAYNETAAKEAWDRTLAFLTKALK
jgi:carboxymethylenebutenolidase